LGRVTKPTVWENRIYLGKLLHFVICAISLIGVYFRESLREVASVPVLNNNADIPRETLDGVACRRRLFLPADVGSRLVRKLRFDEFGAWLRRAQAEKAVARR
jgi:hypothetical protein